jgi:hypothetical protein
VLGYEPRQSWRDHLSAFGPRRVAHAPVQDHGLRQRPAVWAGACFGARVLDDQPQAGVLIRCSAAGPLGDARLRGAAAARDDRTAGGGLVLMYRAEGELVLA